MRMPGTLPQLGFVALLFLLLQCSKKDESQNAGLTGLKFSAGTLTPTFDPAIRSYTLLLNYRYSSITWTPEGAGAATLNGSLITLNNERSYSPSVGDQYLDIVNAGKTTSILVRRARQFVYATSTGAAGNDSVYAYSVDPSTGQLATVANYTVEQDPYDLTVDPSGKYLYVMNSASHTVSQFRINLPDGSLTSLGSIGTVNTPYAGPAVLSSTWFYIPSGNTSNSLGRHSIGSSGSLGALTTLNGPTAGSQVWFMRATPDSKVLYATLYNNATLAQFSIGSDGSLTALAPATIATQTSPWSVEVDPTGKYLYVSNYGSASISQYSIGTNGTLSALTTAQVSAGTQPIGLAIHPSSTYLYAANSGAGTISQYSISGTTGELSALTPATATSTGCYGLAVESEGQYVYAADATNGLVRQFSIGNDGTLSALGTATIASGSQTRFIAVAK